MNRWKLALPVIALTFSSLFAIGCVVEERTVEREPPAERVEVQSAPPTREHVWVRGHWQYDRGDYIWVPGHWQTRRHGYAWQEGRWERTRRGWVWHEGRWIAR